MKRHIDISTLLKELLPVNLAIVRHKGRKFVLEVTYSLTVISKEVLSYLIRKVPQVSGY